MRKLITTIALLALIDTSVAIAQTVGSRNPSAPPPSTNPDKQLLPEAPVGHRQPRVDQVPSEKNLMGDPNDPINREGAVRDRPALKPNPARSLWRPAPCQPPALAASLDARSGESWVMPETTHPMKITFGEMRASGIRDILIYCCDYRCS